MALPSSPSAVQSTTLVMAPSFSDGVVDNRFFSTKRISVLLDDNNYLLWLQKVLLAIKIYKLQHFLDSRTMSPPRQVTDDNGVLQENLEFARFEQQDSALASWLLSSVNFCFVCKTSC
ncbi:uncharacterized protein [Gossypium hirsutum]|uniref:Retrotransposon Copia-like N-terminal domain-containing protein n=1 Tax=Gossypium hirsutum TaxID=3635 RepID=A0ABM3AV91_GOSHI|nr:uncharacterized protein LOC107915216 [Gossypium hirsutum]